MDLTLTVTCHVEGEDRSYELNFQQEMICIGRHSKNDVQLPDQRVSSDHALLEAEGELLFLTDLGSQLGTRIDGSAIEPNLRTAVPKDGKIGIGDYTITVTAAEEPLNETTSGMTAMVAMNMVRDVLGSLSEDEDVPCLEVVNDAEEGARLELQNPDGEYRIGREKACHLVLKHWSISRRHALVRRRLHDVTVMDLNSKNGVTVNGERLEGSWVLHDGDVVAVGHTQLRFHSKMRGMLDELDGVVHEAPNLEDLKLDLDGFEPTTGDATPEPTTKALDPSDPKSGKTSKISTGTWMVFVILALAIAAAAYFLLKS